MVNVCTWILGVMEWCGTMWPNWISMNHSLFSTPVYSTDWILDTLLHVWELKPITPLHPLQLHLSIKKLQLRYLLYGFQLASQVLVSSDLAKNTPKRARWTAIRATRMGILVACATAFALWIGRESIADASLRFRWVLWHPKRSIGLPSREARYPRIIF